MSTSKDYIIYLQEIFRDKNITYKSMFGEYGMYYMGTIVGLVCDEKLYIKNCKATTHFADVYELQSPYPGAKPYYYIPDDLFGDEKKLGSVLEKIAIELPQKKKK